MAKKIVYLYWTEFVVTELFVFAELYTKQP